MNLHCKGANDHDDLGIIDRHIKTSQKIVKWTVCLVFGSYLLWFALIKQLPLSADPSYWGQFGDYVGGMLNPLVAGFALFWLVTSVRLQKQELKDTRNELTEARKAQERQAFMLLLSNQIAARNIQLQHVMRNIESSEADRRFIREGVKDKRFLDLQGRSIKYDHAIEKLAEMDATIRNYEAQRVELMLEILCAAA